MSSSTVPFAVEVVDQGERLPPRLDGEVDIAAVPAVPQTVADLVHPPRRGPPGRHRRVGRPRLLPILSQAN
jgi:hypothetical protein